MEKLRVLNFKFLMVEKAQNMKDREKIKFYRKDQKLWILFTSPNCSVFKRKSIC